LIEQECVLRDDFQVECVDRVAGEVTEILSD
jgi:hypothetical protein